MSYTYESLQIESYTIEEAIELATKSNELFFSNANSIADSSVLYQRWNYDNFINYRLKEMKENDVEVFCIKTPTIDKRKRGIFSFTNYVAKNLTHYKTVWQAILKNEVNEFKCPIIIAQDKTKPDVIKKAEEYIKQYNKDIIIKKIKEPINNIISAELIYNKIEKDKGIFVFIKKIKAENDY